MAERNHTMNDDIAEDDVFDGDMATYNSTTLAPRDADKSKRRFIMISPQGRPMGHEFRNKSPYAAAMKAAHRGFTDIILYAPDTKKIHRYCGCMRDIQEDEHTDYTLRYGITQKAQVKSVKMPSQMQRQGYAMDNYWYQYM